MVIITTNDIKYNWKFQWAALVLLHNIIIDVDRRQFIVLNQ